jgi:hypothetical protein
MIIPRFRRDGCLCSVPAHMRYLLAHQDAATRATFYNRTASDPDTPNPAFHRRMARDLADESRRYLRQMVEAQ